MRACVYACMGVSLQEGMCVCDAHMYVLEGDVKSMHMCVCIYVHAGMYTL